MHVLSQLQAHARDCRNMAEGARDEQSRATWDRMAERWERMLGRVAKGFEQQPSSQGSSMSLGARELGASADPSSHALQACVRDLDRNFRHLALDPLPEKHKELLEALEMRLSGEQPET